MNIKTNGSQRLAKFNQRFGNLGVKLAPSQQNNSKNDLKASLGIHKNVVYQNGNKNIVFELSQAQSQNNDETQKSDELMESLNVEFNSVKWNSLSTAKTCLNFAKEENSNKANDEKINFGYTFEKEVKFLLNNPEILGDKKDEFVKILNKTTKSTKQSKAVVLTPLLDKENVYKTDVEYLNRNGSYTRFTLKTCSKGSSVTLLGQGSIFNFLAYMLKEKCFNKLPHLNNKDIKHLIYAITLMNDALVYLNKSIFKVNKDLLKTEEDKKVFFSQLSKFDKDRTNYIKNLQRNHERLTNNGANLNNDEDLNNLFSIYNAFDFLGNKENFYEMISYCIDNGFKSLNVTCFENFFPEIYHNLCYFFIHNEKEILNYAFKGYFKENIKWLVYQNREHGKVYFYNLIDYFNQNAFKNNNFAERQLKLVNNFNSLHFGLLNFYLSFDKGLSVVLDTRNMKPSIVLKMNLSETIKNYVLENF